MSFKAQPCDVESLDDFARYYRHSFVPFEGQAWQVMGSEEGGTVYLMRDHGEERHVPWVMFQLGSSFGIPSLGMRNMGASAAFLYTIAARQSNRGFIASLCGATQFNSWENRKYPKPRLDSWEMVNEVFFPRFYTLPLAVLALDNGERSGCALGVDTCLYTTDKSDTTLIGFKRNTVGYLLGWEPVLFKKYERVFPVISKSLGVKSIFVKDPNSRTNERKTL